MAAIASQQLYTIAAYGRGYIIKCTQPDVCHFYGRKYLTIAEGASIKATSYWNDSQNGWIVRGSDYDRAKAFIDYLNAKADTGAPGAEEKEAAQTLATMGGARDDNFTLERYGRGYLIKCSDPSECPWWGAQYIALSDTEGAGTAFWNAKLGGYIVRNRDADEAEHFVHLANHPKSPRTSAPTTPPRRTRRASPPPAPRRSRKSRTFPTEETDGGEVHFTRATARRLFQAEQEGEAGEVVEEDSDSDSDSDYVPSDEESDDDDAEFDEVTSEGPYTGMTLRYRGRGGYRRSTYYLTCAASHHLHGRPFLGHPAARGVRDNCWEVRGETVQQFLDGGAKMEE